MMLKLITAITVALAGFVGLQDTQDLDGVKCVIMGKRAADADHAVDYKGGKVYLCCGGCEKKFAADQELEEPKFAVKANHQLVLTGQFVQKGCPFSGAPIAEGQVAEVGGVEVGFCCENCAGKVNGAEGLEAKAAMVFSKDAFEKGFAKKPDLSNATCPISGGDINEEQFASHHGGKVYFCCGNCKAKFEKDATPFVVKSNHQLALTGQVTQKACPFSGGDVSDEQTVEVAGVSVKMCCGNCVKKVNAADSDEAKAELVFSAEAFEKGFGGDE